VVPRLLVRVDRDAQLAQRLAQLGLLRAPRRGFREGQHGEREDGHDRRGDDQFDEREAARAHFGPTPTVFASGAATAIGCPAAFSSVTFSMRSALAVPGAPSTRSAMRAPLAPRASGRRPGVAAPSAANTAGS